MGNVFVTVDIQIITKLLPLKLRCFFFLLKLYIIIFAVDAYNHLINSILVVYYVYEVR